MPTERLSQHAGALHDLASRVHGRQSDNAFLQIYDD
jgi:hypothetical protein